jgi:hypothetical protein
VNFEGTIEEAPRGGAFVRIPPDVAALHGDGGRIPVVAVFDGIGYRGSIVRMGGHSVLGVAKEIREGLGKGPGDVIEVSVEPDTEPRVVEVPTELTNLLDANPVAREAFDALSYSHRREHARYVAEAKQPETRERRARKTVESLTG